MENQLHDSREWYKEHKDDYTKYIVEPFTEFVNELTPTMLSVDKDFICSPKKISRLYRDARYAKGKSIFRNDVWYSFRRLTEPFEALPEFYFDISPDGFSYGCGYYMASRDTMDAIRAMIIDDSKEWKAAKKAFDSQNVFEMGGDLYKKNRFPDESGDKLLWLNRKSVFFFNNSTDFDRLFSADFAKSVAEDYKKLAPIYSFLMAAEQKRRSDDASNCTRGRGTI